MFACALLTLFSFSFPELCPSSGPSILLTFEICLRAFLACPIAPRLNVDPMATPLQYAPDKVQKILVGNKSDEVEKRQVSTAQGIEVGRFTFAYRSPFFFFLFFSLDSSTKKRHFPNQYHKTLLIHMHLCHRA